MHLNKAILALRAARLPDGSFAEPAVGETSREAGAGHEQILAHMDASEMPDNAKLGIRIPDSPMDKADFAIIIPTFDEFKAIRRVFIDTKPLSVRDVGGIKEVRQFQFLQCVGVIVLMDTIGRLSAALATAEVLRRWNPENLLLVGKCGGVAARGISLGDVVLADAVRDYESQTLTRSTRHIHWDVTYDLDRDALQWLQAVKQTWRPTLIPGGRTPSVHIGTVLSGDKIVASSAILTDLAMAMPFIAIEMEAGGVVKALKSYRPTRRLFVVRGVSDLADEAKDQVRRNTRKHACDMAASLARHLLEYLLNPEHRRS